MKLVWCPETAGKAYIETIQLLTAAADDIDPENKDVAELVAAMAGGWRAQRIVETWSTGDPAATSLALATAARHTGGRHVCVVPDEGARAEYEELMGGNEVEVVVGDPSEAIGDVDFAVVDSKKGEVMRWLSIGGRGAVVVCRGGEGRWWKRAALAGWRVVRAAVLPTGGGLEIVHVGAGKGPGLMGRDRHQSRRSRWIRHVNRRTGEEHVFRR